jgi:hypothetical protein
MIYALLAQTKDSGSTKLTNPAVGFVDTTTAGAATGAEAGAMILGRYVAVMIQTSLVVGGLAVLAYMVLGGVNWITAGGDAGKIEKARGQIVQALVGLAVLASVTAIAEFVSKIFGFDLLKIEFINQL